MKRSLLFAGLILVLHFAPASFAADSLKVLKLADGDTITLENPDGGKNLKIRMISIDSAELHLPAPGGVYSQGHWAEEAAKHLESLIPVGTRVELESHGTDSYGRVLGRIFLKGRDINLEMVRAGHAIPYVICEGTDCNDSFMKRHEVDAYIQACRNAKKEGRGLFNPRDPLTEMPFEFRLRIQKRKPDKFVGDYETGTFVEPKNYSRVELCQRIFFMKSSEAERIGFRPAH
jgi:endonuclease YncB( thermonuclease family)